VSARVVQRYKNPVIWAVDFTALSAGANATLPNGLAYTCATAARTVQNGAAAIIASIGANAAPIGRLLGTDSYGLSLDPAYTNVVPNNRDFTQSSWTAGSGVTYTAGQTSPDGGTGGQRVQVSSGGFANYRSNGALANGTYSAMQWMRASSATTSQQWYVFDGAAHASAEISTLTTTYEKRTRILASTSGAGLVPQDGRDQSGSGGGAAGARDACRCAIDAHYRATTHRWRPDEPGVLAATKRLVERVPERHVPSR